MPGTSALDLGLKIQDRSHAEGVGFITLENNSLQSDSVGSLNNFILFSRSRNTLLNKCILNHFCTNFLHAMFTSSGDTQLHDVTVIGSQSPV